MRNIKRILFFFFYPCSSLNVDSIIISFVVVFFNVRTHFNVELK